MEWQLDVKGGQKNVWRWQGTSAGSHRRSGGVGNSGVPADLYRKGNGTGEAIFTSNQECVCERA